MYHNDQNNDNDECSVCPSLLGPGCYHLPIIQSGIQWYFREYIQHKQAFFAPTQCRQRPKNTYGVLPFWRKLRLAPAYADV